MTIPEFVATTVPGQPSARFFDSTVESGIIRAVCDQSCHAIYDLLHGRKLRRDPVLTLYALDFLQYSRQKLADLGAGKEQRMVNVNSPVEMAQVIAHDLYRILPRRDRPATFKGFMPEWIALSLALRQREQPDHRVRSYPELGSFINIHHTLQRTMYNFELGGDDLLGNLLDGATYSFTQSGYQDENKDLLLEFSTSRSKAVTEHFARYFPCCIELISPPLTSTLQ